jgi:hypothetical protein
MEPVFMMLGQAAASAACLVLKEGKTLHTLDYTTLREQLIKDGQKLKFE